MCVCVFFFFFSVWGLGCFGFRVEGLGVAHQKGTHPLRNCHRGV